MLSEEITVRRLVFVTSDELSLEELLSDESLDVICSVATAPSV